MCIYVDYRIRFTTLLHRADRWPGCVVSATEHDRNKPFLEQRCDRIVLCIVVLGGVGSIPGIIVAAFVLAFWWSVFHELGSKPTERREEKAGVGDTPRSSCCCG